MTFANPFKALTKQVVGNTNNTNSFSNPTISSNWSSDTKLEAPASKKCTEATTASKTNMDGIDTLSETKIMVNPAEDMTDNVIIPEKPISIAESNKDTIKVIETQEAQWFPLLSVPFWVTFGPPPGRPGF